MKYYRKGIIFVLLMALVLMTACSNKAAQSSSGTAGASSGKSNDLYVIKVLDANAKNIKRSDETEIGKVIKDKFNIVFEYVSFTGNIADQMNMMLSAGNYPEIVHLSGNDNLDKYIKAGALLPLDDYLKNAPEFQKRYAEQIPLWRLSSPDGKLYKWESNVPADYNNALEALDVGIRLDVLQKEGYPKLLSTQDYINFLKKALQDFPTTNGQKSIGMVVPFAEAWGMQGISGIMYEKGGRYSTAAGNLGVIWNQVDKKYEDYMTNEYVKENLQFFNQLYREGILDKDSFTDLYPQVQQKLQSGRAIAQWYPFSAENPTVRKNGHPEWQMIDLPIRSMTQVQRNEKRQIRVEDTRAFDMYGITKNAKHPDRIFQLLEWAASDEGKTLLQSGIKDVDYKIDNGKRVPTDEYKKVVQDPDLSLKKGFNLFGMLGYVSTNAPDGVPYDMKLDPKLNDELNLSPEIVDAYKKLGWKDSKDYWRSTGEAAHTGISASIAIDTTSELGNLQQKMVDFRVKNSSKLITEPKSDDEFEKLYASIINDYKKLNPEKVVDKYNELYKEKQAQVDKLKK